MALFVSYYPEAVHIHDLECEIDGAVVRCDVLYSSEAFSAIMVIAAQTGWDVPTTLSRCVFYPCASFRREMGDVPQTPTIPRRAPVADKKAILGEWARRNGWFAKEVGCSSEYTKGPELIVAAWDGARWDGIASVWTRGERSERVPSSTVALALLEGTLSSPREGGRKPLYRFDGSEADAYIIATCLGRKVSWTNSLSGELETARLYPDGPGNNRHTKVEISATGRRVLTFVENGGGFRSVAIESIVEVR